jgi:23S rRNA pseudouridine1911/1915/1917 synthase
MNTLDFTVEPAEAGARLDVVVAGRAGVSRSAAARFPATVDGEAAPKSLRLAAGQRVSVQVLPPAPEAPAAEDVAVPVVYEDEWLLVVSKPAGLVVHPAPGHPAGTLVNALLSRAGRPAGGDRDRPGIVHRLDAGTSGLMIVAKHGDAHRRLVEMMAAREVRRTYLALVEGAPAIPTGTIDAPVGRSPRHRRKMAVVASGRAALTRYRTLERFADCTLMEVAPETGRTHQIRVHLAAAGMPVAGDRVYGRTGRLTLRLGLERPFLHAARLELEHPMTGEPLRLEDPLPEDLSAALARARV